ncbi:Udp-glycosyltransferase 85a8 [Thalictrum thalictroides]|uniref:Glycosyltransferase n=1 Tax=Thalictrum thalictroides TaxID=46969 RepID=A0A7J6VN51_THATH|nr:Udp-glycosyltransferase 85a8 [Thalictrum thalictroides]
MESFTKPKKHHAICLPFPLQSHINAMLKLAKLLHFKGLHITFVNTEFNHQRLLNTVGYNALKGLPDFRFETIPDGLPPSDINTSQDILKILNSFSENCLVPLINLISKLNQVIDDPRVSCIVADSSTSFALEAAEKHGIPGVIFLPMSPCFMACYLHCQHLINKGLIPPIDKRTPENWYPDMPFNVIPGLRDIRVKDLPTFFGDENNVVQDFCFRVNNESSKATAIIMHTFDTLESEILNAIKSLLPPIYTIGPLQLLEQNIPKTHHLTSFRSNLLKEDQKCLEWLDMKEPNSVVYVNFGSVTVLTKQQLIEFAWGLANCKYPFLWVIRSDIVIGEAAILPPEFTEETADRGMISGWCPQEQVLGHSAVGAFLTHSGWNSTMDTICSGVPIISWPFGGDQMINCRYSCFHWGIGMEMDKDVQRDKVEELVREVMEGDKGKKMKEKAMEWKKSAHESTKPGGSSYVNLDKVVKEVLAIKDLD